MSKLWSWILVAVVASCIAAGSAWAQDGKKKGDKPKPTPEEVFKKLDKENQGKVTLAEFTARAKDPQKKEALEKRFKALDKNNDGVLTLDEFKAGMKAHGDRKKKSAS